MTYNECSKCKASFRVCAKELGHFGEFEALSTDLGLIVRSAEVVNALNIEYSV